MTSSTLRILLLTTALLSSWNPAQGNEAEILLDSPAPTVTVQGTQNRVAPESLTLEKASLFHFHKGQRGEGIFATTTQDAEMVRLAQSHPDFQSTLMVGSQKGGYGSCVYIGLNGAGEHIALTNAHCVPVQCLKKGTKSPLFIWVPNASGELVPQAVKTIEIHPNHLRDVNIKGLKYKQDIAKLVLEGPLEGIAPAVLSTSIPKKYVATAVTDSLPVLFHAFAQEQAKIQGFLAFQDLGPYDMRGDDALFSQEQLDKIKNQVQAKIKELEELQGAPDTDLSTLSKKLDAANKTTFLQYFLTAILISESKNLTEHNTRAREAIQASTSSIIPFNDKVVVGVGFGYKGNTGDRFPIYDNLKRATFILNPIPHVITSAGSDSDMNSEDYTGLSTVTDAQVGMPGMHGNRQGMSGGGVYLVNPETNQAELIGLNVSGSEQRHKKGWRKLISWLRNYRQDPVISYVVGSVYLPSFHDWIQAPTRPTEITWGQRFKNRWFLYI